MNLRDLAPHLRPARGLLALAVASSVAGGLAVIGQAFAVGGLVVAVATGGSLVTPAAWLAALLVVRAGCGAVVELATAASAARVGTHLRGRLLSAALTATGTRRRTGELAVLLTRGVEATGPWFTRYLPAMLLAGVLPLATLATITWLDPWSGLIVVLTLPLVPLFAALVGVATRDKARAQWRLMGSLSGHFVDVLRGLPTLVAHRRAEAQGTTIRAVTDRYRRASADTLRLAFASSVVLELVATLSVAVVAVCVGLRLAAGTLDFRTALIVLLLAPEAYWPLRRVGAEFHAAAEGGAALDDAQRVLADPVAGGGLAALPGRITLTGVTLGYDGRPVVDSLTLSLGPGLTAVTGPSGCGKSTLLAALVGELRPMSGRIAVGDDDVSDLDPDDWRRQVAWAPQRPWLFAGTVADNVRIGRPGATDAEIWSALESAGLAHVVLTLAGGIDSPLGEDGAGLSAGERARLVLARILLADRPVVVLDEPTAHLDADTEQVLLEAVRLLARDRIVVVVAHREAVAAAADHVVALAPMTAVVPARTPAPAARPLPPLPDEDRPSRPWAGVVLGALSAISGVALTATAGWLITRAAAHPPVLHLMVAIVAVRAFGIARPVLAYVERLASHDLALRLLARRRAEVYDALVPLVPGRLDLRRGDLLATVVDDVDVVVDERLRVRDPLLAGGLVSLAAVGVAAWLLPVAGLVIALAVVLTAVVVAVVFRLAGAAERAQVAARGALGIGVEEALSAGRNLVLWQRDDDAVAGVEEASRRLGLAAVRSARVRAASRALLVVAFGAAVPLIAWLAQDTVAPATAALLVLLPLALADVLVPLVDAGALAGRCRGARARLAALDAMTPAVAEVATPLTLPGGRTRVDVLDGGIDRFPVSFELAPGDRVGIVGPSGSGKSTLAAQLVRFRDPVSGRVTFDGRDARDLRLADVRSRVGLVDDDPYLFATTLAENVRLARPGASDDDVRRSLEQARLGSWVAGLPNGLHTRIGEGHAAVSGGERARIGIARALLADQPVVVLDEPTAHLDLETAQRVAHDVAAATQGRSLVWISHTDAGLDLMDRIVEVGVTSGLVRGS